MMEQHWVPNHFIPLLLIAPPDSVSAEEASIPVSSTFQSDQSCDKQEMDSD